MQHRRPLRNDITGLRAVAVLLVVANHVFSRPTGGYVGVDVFFVISGYLITGMLLSPHSAKRMSFREFYARRVRRIIPAAVLVLVATDVAAHFFFFAYRAHDTLVDSMWALVFSANVHFAAVGTNYFAASGLPSPLQHYWTLSVEEQFYLVWPLLLFVVIRLLRGRSRAISTAAIVALATAVTVASFLFGRHLTDTSPVGAYFSTPARAWELGLGCISAMAQPLFDRLRTPIRAGLAWAGLGGIAVSALSYTSSTPFPGAAAATPVVATAFVLLANNPPYGIGGRWLLGSRVPQYVGLISYSLYLWHWPCVVFAADYFGKGGLRYYLAAIALPLVMAALSFHLLEDPIRRSTWLSRKSAGDRPSLPVRPIEKLRPVLLALCPVLLITTVIAIGAANDHGRPPTGAIPAPLSLLHGGGTGGVPPLTVLQADLARSINTTGWGQLNPPLDDLPAAKAPQLIRCLYVTTTADLAACSFGPRSASHTAVVVGDSYAVSYLPGIIDALAPHSWRVEAMTWGQCPNIAVPGQMSVVGPACVRHHQWMVDQLREQHPDLVILTDAAQQAAELVRPQPSSIAVWQHGTESLLAAIRGTSDRIVVLAGPPGSGNLGACINAAGSTAACMSTISREYRTVRTAERSAAQAEGARYIDTEQWFCDNERCPPIVGPTPVYWDGLHLTVQYSEALAPLLEVALLRG